jgi:hypothetical protein
LFVPLALQVLPTSDQQASAWLQQRVASQLLSHLLLHQLLLLMQWCCSHLQPMMQLPGCLHRGLEQQLQTDRLLASLPSWWLAAAASEVQGASRLLLLLLVVVALLHSPLLLAQP